MESLPGYDEWLERPYQQYYSQEERDQEDDRWYPRTYTITRRDGRRQETCTCPAYKFPHAVGKGKCRNW